MLSTSMKSMPSPQANVPRDESFDFIPHSDLRKPSSSLRIAGQTPDSLRSASGPAHFANSHNSHDMEPRVQMRSTSTPLMTPVGAQFPFLMADHSFDASSLANPRAPRDPATICLSFDAGDVVFVHFAHESGWADATMLKTAVRGWVPANYFSPFTDSRAIALLSASANFVRAPRSYRLAKRRDAWSFSQGAINEIVSGVRSALAATSILKRDSMVTQRSPDVRRARKALLTELAHVVLVAKENKHTTDRSVIDKLVRGILRTVNKLVYLLDACEADIAEFGPPPITDADKDPAYDYDSDDSNSVRQTHHRRSSTTSHIRQHSFAGSSSNDTITRSRTGPHSSVSRSRSSSMTRSRSLSPARSSSDRSVAKHSETGIRDSDSGSPRRSLRSHRRSSSTTAAASLVRYEQSDLPMPAMLVASNTGSNSSLVTSAIAEAASSTTSRGVSPHTPLEPTKEHRDPDMNIYPASNKNTGDSRVAGITDRYSGLSVASHGSTEIDPLEKPSELTLSPITMASSPESHNLKVKRQRSHIASFQEQPPVPDVKERLNEIETALHSLLQNFGSHESLLKMTSEDPASAWEQLLSSTRFSTLACRELLTVLDAVAENSGNRSLEAHKDALFHEIRHLVSVARAVVHSDIDADPVSLSKSDNYYRSTENLINVARKCNDLAENCISEVRATLRSMDMSSHKVQITLPCDREYPSLIDLNASFASSSSADLPPKGLASAASAPSKLLFYESSNKDGAGEPKDGDHAETLDGLMNGLSLQPCLDIVNIPPLTADSSKLYECESSIDSEPFVSPLKKSYVVGTSTSDSVDAPESDASRTDSVSLSTPVDSQVATLLTPLVDSGELIFRNGAIRGGTLRGLVIYLCGSESATWFQIASFLLVFRLFATPLELVAILREVPSYLAEWADNYLSTTTNRVTELVTLWLESFWRAGDESALSDIEGILDSEPGKKLIENRKRLGLQGQLQIKPRYLDFDGIADSGSRSSSTSLSSSSTSLAAKSRSASMSSDKKIHIDKTRRPSAASVVLNLGLGLSGPRRTSRRVSHEDLRNLGSSWGAALRIGSNGSSTDLSSGNSNTRDFAGQRIIDLEASEVAAQLTLMSVEIFTSLRPDELLDQRFAPNKKALGLAPHVAQLVLASNHLTTFIGDTILGSEHLSTKSRSRILKTWLKIAENAYELGNLNTVVTIMLALQSGKIMRLRKVWDGLSPKSQAILNRLAGLTAPERNFSEYRRELRSRQGKPCIPYIGLFLSDLTLIDEGNPKTLSPPAGCELEETVYNFDRYLRSTRVIALLQSHQRLVPRGQIPNQSLQSWLRTEMAKSHAAATRDNDEQWRRSYIVEPN